MTYSQLEARAKRLSFLGFKLRLFEDKEGWVWEWGYQGTVIKRNATNAKPKGVALVFALEDLNA
jgi:hypothetical protein